MRLDILIFVSSHPAFCLHDSINMASVRLMTTKEVQGRRVNCGGGEWGRSQIAGRATGGWWRTWMLCLHRPPAVGINSFQNRVRLVPSQTHHHQFVCTHTTFWQSSLSNTMSRLKSCFVFNGAYGVLDQRLRAAVLGTILGVRTFWKGFVQGCPVVEGQIQ